MKPAPRMFYGWIMVGVAIAMGIATMPGQTVLVSLFNKPFRESLGVSVIELSAAYAAGTILAAFPLSLVGRAADRFGLRIVTGLVSLSFAAALVYLSRVSGAIVAAPIALGIGFFLVRFLGQGSLGMLAGHTVSMWFERRLGRVHSMLVIGFAGGSAILPQPVAWLIADFGWRTALLVLSALVLVLTIPSVLFLFRNRPEDIGQHLDGDPGEHTTHDVMHGGTPPPNDPAFTARQAMATRAYWIIVTNLVAAGLIGTALLFHMGAMLEAAGLEGTEHQSALAIQPWPIAFGVSTLAVGWIADRRPPAGLLVAGPVLMAVACGLCLSATLADLCAGGTIALMGAGMAVFGVSQAVVMGVGNPTIARYFGRTHHGSIRGSIATATVAGTGAGPLLAGLVYDLAGHSFTPILIAFGASCVPLALGALLLNRPTPPRERDLSRPDRDEPDPSGLEL